MSWEDIIKVGSKAFDYRERAGKRILDERSRQELEQKRMEIENEIDRMMQQVEQKKKEIEQKKKELLRMAQERQATAMFHND